MAKLINKGEIMDYELILCMLLIESCRASVILDAKSYIFRPSLVGSNHDIE